MKIAICAPCNGDTKALYTVALVGTVAHSVALGRKIECFLAKGAMLPDARQQALVAALRWNPDYVLWSDVDHTFPRQSLERLISHGLDFVGCNFATRLVARQAAAASTTKEKADADLIEEVEHVGLGLTLTKASIYSRLRGPLFDFAREPDGRLIGEDVGFCRKARSAGIKIHVDHRLSWECGHLAEKMLRLSDVPPLRVGRQVTIGGGVDARTVLASPGNK